MFRSACADWNTVPTGSMNPTIIEGDRIAVNKMAYDLRIPFTHISLRKLGDPERGDIAVFDSKVSDKRLVKRVIGVPGDRVAMINNQLLINDAVIDYDKTEKCCKSSNVNIKNIFNMRFCSNRVRNALIQMFKSNTYFRKCHHSYK